MKLTLLPFESQYAAEIAGWPLDAGEAQAWTGHDAPFPMLADQFCIWHEDSDIHAFVAFDEGSLIAYGEIWVDEEENEVELARIIVAPSSRGMGIGRSFVKALINQTATYGMQNILIRVLPNNHPAIRCYQASGFVEISGDELEIFNQEQPTAYVWMKYHRTRGK